MIFEVKRSVKNIKNALIFGNLLIVLLLHQCVFALNLLAAASVPVSTNNLLIYQLQTGAIGSAAQEYAAIYNNSATSVDVTGYCLVYASASDNTQTPLACLDAPDTRTRLYLPSHRAATFATNEFVQGHPVFMPDQVLSAGIAASGGHIKLLNPAKDIVDVLGWGSAAHPEGLAAAVHATGKILQRHTEGDVLSDANVNMADFSPVDLVELPLSTVYEESDPFDICPNLPDLQEVLPTGYMPNIMGNCVEDICLNIDGLQTDVPGNFDGYPDHTCIQTVLENRVLFISEILPNPGGSDAGNEYIELYNPHNEPVNLAGYMLQVGPSFTKSYSLPDVQIFAHSYVSLSDVQTKITLPNTSASVRLLAPSGEVVSNSKAYDQAADDVAWVYFNDGWYSSYEPTPGEPNVVVSIKPCQDGYVRSAESGYCRLASTSEEETAQVVCLPDQERNPETNRCRKVPVLASLIACKPGQSRTSETGRCRSSVAAKTTTICKSDQIRNPETGRCRKATPATVQKTCPAGQVRNAETNRCRKTTGAAGSGKLTEVRDVSTPLIKNNVQWWVAGIGGTGSLGYGVYEWRRETLGFLLRLKGRVLPS